MRLVIVESPNKAPKIQEMFSDVKCMATGGHICDLPENPKDGIGIDRNTLAGQYALTSDSTRNSDGVRVIARFKKFLAQNPDADVYLATDGDREGESISAFVVKYLGLRQYRRIRTNAITKEKFEEAFANAGPIDWAAVSAREARRLIDRIIGYTVSPLLGRILKQRGVSAGRVQTAVEALIVERERKIRNHKGRPYYTVRYDMGGWVAEWRVPTPAKERPAGPKPNSEYDVDDNTARCFDRAAADHAASFRSLQVLNCADAIEERLPPAPLHTVAMLQVADRVLNWSADKTMQVAQKLFEGDGGGHGHITYHRTDLQNLDPAAAEEIRDWLRQRGLPVPDKPNHWPSKNKFAQEGHEGIRPTYLNVEDAGADDDQRALYRIIRERAIYSQLAPARFALKRIELIEPVRREHVFTALARSLMSPGWLGTAAAGAATTKDDDASDADPPIILPTLTKGVILNRKASEVKEHTTKAPPRYTARTLMSKLESLSIGRPATITGIMKSLARKGHIRKDGKLQATPVSEQCYDVLYPRFSFAHIGYTAELELALDQIASEKLDGLKLTRFVWDQLDKDCQALTGTIST